MAPRWGIVSTIKAPTGDILRFAAWHLEQGAHRLYIYLDDPESAAFAPLKAHPKIRVRRCDDTWWEKQVGRRPVKHQVRQTSNATHAYARPAEVDWLVHIDVDEFLLPDRSIAECLALQSPDTLTLRVRPSEALSGHTHAFKAFMPPGRDRAEIVARLYPSFGPHLRGGFVSHTAGKLFVRTGLGALKVRIHNVFRGEDMNPGEAESDQITLLHCHATSWEDWLAHYGYRLQFGSYRADLPAVRPASKGGMSLNDLFRWLEAEAGQDGLRSFFDEVMSDAAGLPERLAAEGLLRRHDLDLERLVQTHFPHTKPPT